MSVLEFLAARPLLFAGLLLVTITIVLRRNRARRKPPWPIDAPCDRAGKGGVMPESGAARIRELEIRLFDFAREVEGRIESRQLLLDRLMAAADREIARLQGLLGRGRAESGIPGEETRGRRPDLVQYGPPDSPPAGRDLRAAASPRQPSTGILAQAMLAMADEGRSIDEIALATGQPQAKVQALIDALRSLDRREAA